MAMGYVPVHGTLPRTTPLVHLLQPRLHALPDGRARLDGSVLWALNDVCVTLKWLHIDFWSRLSGLWLAFKPHVARTILFRRPQGA